MKLQVKTGQRNPIQEEGYYAAVIRDIEQDPRSNGDSELLLVDLTITYNGEEVDYIDKVYATLGNNSKLTQLCIAVGYADTYDTAVARSEVDEGIDFDEFIGRQVRTHFETKRSKDNRAYISLGGYLPPAKPKIRPSFGKAADFDDIPL